MRWDPSSSRGSDFLGNGKREEPQIFFGNTYEARRDGKMPTPRGTPKQQGEEEFHIRVKF